MQDLTNINKKVVKVLRRNQNVIINNILNQTQDGMWAGLEDKIEKVASYHAVAFHGFFKDHMLQSLQKDMDKLTTSEKTSIWVRDNVKKTIDFMSGLNLNFKPMGKLEEGETLDFKGSFV